MSSSHKSSSPSSMANSMAYNKWTLLARQTPVLTLNNNITDVQEWPANDFNSVVFNVAMIIKFSSYATLEV